MELRPLDLFPLRVESSIYGMTAIEDKMLVATSDCKIFCIEFNKLKPHIREIEFAYIPNGAKIISISALKRDQHDFVIGIAHCKNNLYYFNVYTSGFSIHNSSEYRDRCAVDLEHLAQGCQTIRLRYVPYHSLSTTIITPNSDRISPCWMMSGGDNRVHVFVEDLDSHSFEERPIGSYFSELDTSFECPALWIDVLHIQQSTKQRATAVAFENGTVRLFLSYLISETGRYDLVKSFLFNEYTTIVPSVRLFPIKSSTSKSSRLQEKLQSNQGSSTPGAVTSQGNPEDCINLLIVSSTHQCLIFEDIFRKGLDSKQELPKSQRLDCNTTCAVGDVNFDGKNEILIGNHGKELLIYKYNGEQKQFDLDHVQLFNNPLYSLSILDITKDVLQDVVILLSNGILILQSVVGEAIEVCKQRVDFLISRLN